MTEKNLPITGGCLCGAIRYESRELPSDSNYCHCRMCQRSSGAPLLASVTFPKHAFQFTRGEPRFFQSSQLAERGFCARCGSQLIYRPIVMTDVEAVYIWSGTLDHPEIAAPKWHTGIESQVPWLIIDDNLPRMRTDDNPDVSTLKSAPDYRED